MDLARPYGAIATALDGDALYVLAAADRLTGRQVARLVRRGSQPAVNAALGRLVRQGLVTRESVPPANLYSLNRDHVGYPAVEALAGMRTELLRRLRARFESWEPAPIHASLFGSAARADGGVDSDVDLLVMRPRNLGEADERWEAQLGDLATAVQSWTGNAASVLEIEEGSLTDVLVGRMPVLTGWREDAIVLAGCSVEAAIGVDR